MRGHVATFGSRGRRIPKLTDNPSRGRALTFRICARLPVCVRDSDGRPTRARSMRRGALSRRALHGHRDRAASKVRRAPPHSPRRVRTSLAPARPLAPTVAARRAGESDHFRARGRHSVFGLSRFLLTITEAKRAYTHVPSALAHARRDRIPHAKARGERHAPGAMLPAWPARFHFGGARGIRKPAKVARIRVPHTPDAVGRVASLRQGRGFVQLGIPSAFVVLACVSSY